MKNYSIKIPLTAKFAIAAIRFRDVSKIYDYFSSDYDSLFKEAQEYTANKIVKYIANNNFACTKVLDLGCGTGILTIAIGKISESVVGADFSSNMILVAEAKSKGMKLKYIKVDIMDPLKIGGCYDIILALGVIPHIKEQIADSWFSDIKAMLNPGGHFIIGISKAPWRWFQKNARYKKTKTFDTMLANIFNIIMSLLRINTQCWYIENSSIESLLCKQGYKVARIAKDEITIIDAWI